MVPTQIFKLLIISIVCTACASPYRIQNKYLPQYQSGHLLEAESNLKNIIATELPKNSYTTSRNAVWYLLNLATIEFARGNIKDAVASYHLALIALDYYSQPSSSDLTSQLTLEDQYSGFAGAPFEQTLARLYFALALIQNGDLSNAEAVLRETEEKPLQPNILCKYIFAKLLQKRGDLSNASLLLSQISKETNYDKNAATVVIICHNGHVPFKVSTMAPASDASLVALELFLQNNRRPPALSSLPGVPIPCLSHYPASFPQPVSAAVDHIQKPLCSWYNIAHEAAAYLEGERPVIIARGIARYLLRRSAVFAANEHDESLGLITDLGCLIANATTDADTRSWDTLPYSIDLAHFTMPTTSTRETPLSITIQELPCPFNYHQKLYLKANDLCIINVFCLHPGIHTIHIPQQFIKEGHSS